MKPNTLLKVVGIIYIVVCVLGLILAVLTAVMGGAVLGAAAESASVGIVTGSLAVVLLGGGSLFGLVAGILAVKGQYTGCKVIGVILLVFGVISAVSGVSVNSSVGGIIVSIAMPLVLPVLYTIGAFKGPKD